MVKTALIAWIALALVVPASASEPEIVVYSARKEHLIKPLFDAYADETGVRIRYITDKAGPLLARLKAEGRRSPADLLLTVDAGNLWHAAQAGVLQAVDSQLLERNVPAHLRDPQGRWFGLSVRARTIAYNTQRVRPEELSTYEALAEPRWKGRLCLRTSKKVYNQSLVAMMLARLGEQRTEEIVRGWVANLAAPPFSNDTKALEAVAAGRCDVTIVNTYYFGRLKRAKPSLPLAIFWPNQGAGEGGVHVNVSGGGVTAHAPHREAAVALLEWLSQPKAQEMFAGLNMEYPVNPAVAPDSQVAAWGRFHADSTHLAKAGEFQARAVMLMDRARWR